VAKRAKKEIKLNKLAQYRHVQMLKKMERQSLLAYRFVMRALLKDIQKGLKKEKLAKSDNPFDKLPPGWTGEVPKIEIDLEGVVKKKITKYLRGLRWVMLGNFAGKASKEAAKDVGLIGKITPGLLQSAYLQSLDAHRDHHFDVFGLEATEINRRLIQASIKQIVSRANRFMDQLLIQIRNTVMESLSLAVEEINNTNMANVMKEAHDLLPRDGAEAAVEAAREEAVTTLSSKKLAREFNRGALKMENNWDRVARTELANSSSVGTHQAVYEIYGDKEDDVRVVWVEMEDEKVCKFCKLASKNSDGTFKYYKISDFHPSGYNYGKKRSEWELQVPPAHPRCRCDLVYVPKGFEVDRDGTLKPKV
jgi:hypothetical protein